MKILKNKKAFTLVEMMIVVIIIGILMSALLPKLTGAQARARDTARQVSLSQISTALKMYFNDKWKYPDWQCTTDLTGSDKLWPYMPEIPKDPQNKRIAYWTKSTGCKWVFAYMPIKNKWANKSAFALITNVESFGKNMNFILYSGTSTNDYKKVYFSWSTSDLKNEIKYKCSEWVFESGSNNDGATRCNTDNSKNKWYLPKKKSTYWVYVILNG